MLFGRCTYSFTCNHLLSSLLKVLQTILSKMTIVDVSSLSSQVTFKPVSHPLQLSIHFFHTPNPTYPSVFLAINLTMYKKYSEIYGVSVFHLLNYIRVRIDLLHRWHLCLRIKCIQFDNQPLTFWFKPVSVFGLFNLTVLTIIHLRYPYCPTLAPVPT